MKAYIYDILVLFSMLVMTLGIVGIVRMPDIYTKLHGASKSVFLGVVLLAASTLVVASEPSRDRIVLIMILVVLTTPIASYVVGRAAYIKHEAMTSPGAVDESHRLVHDDEEPVSEPTWRF